MKFCHERVAAREKGLPFKSRYVLYPVYEVFFCALYDAANVRGTSLRHVYSTGSVEIARLL